MYTRGVETRFALDDLVQGRVGEAISFAASQAPDFSEELRYRLYLQCKMAELSVNVAGDLLFVGVSWGKSTHAILRYLDGRLEGKTIWLLDKWQGLHRGHREVVKTDFCRDVEHVKKAFAYSKVPIVIVEDYAPDGLSKINASAFSFVSLNTGDLDAHSKSIPLLLPKVSVGGVMVIGAFSKTPAHLTANLKAIEASGIDVTTINLLNGMGVAIRSRSKSR